MDKLDPLLHQVLTDPSFCARFLEAPGDVLRAHGVEPTDDLLEAVQGLDVPTLQKLAKAFRSHPAAL